MNILHRTASLISLILCIILLACSPQNGPTTAGSERSSLSEENTIKVDHGKLIYRKYCVRCHGTKGNLGGSGAFDLTKSSLSFDEKIEIVRYGRSIMTSFDKVLTAAEINLVVEYTEKLKEGS